MGDPPQSPSKVAHLYQLVPFNDLVPGADMTNMSREATPITATCSISTEPEGTSGNKTYNTVVKLSEV